MGSSDGSLGFHDMESSEFNKHPQRERERERETEREREREKRERERERDRQREAIRFDWGLCSVF